MTSIVSDRDLIEAVAGGDPHAGHEFVRRYQRFALHVLRGAGLGPGAIEDACQDVFVRLFRDRMAVLRAWRGDENFHHYLAAIARHVAADTYRAGGPARVPIDDPRVREPADPRADPRGDVLAAERREAVAAALRELSPGDRELFRLTYVEGCSPVAIAGMLGITRNAVDQRLYQLRKRCGRRLAVSFPGLFGDDPFDAGRT